MSEYPTLKQMGINNPNQIERYSYETVNNLDILRVVYKRKKDSFLPSSKRFRFYRIEKVVLVEGDARGTQIHYETAPVMRQALIELDQIVNSREDRRSQIEILEDELKRLVEDNAVRYASIKALVENLK